MNNCILYHGSTVEVKSPLVNIGRKELDFGPGFYLTRDKSQAESWAITLAGRKKNADPILNTYSFDQTSFQNEKFKMLVFTEYSIEWLDFIASSRKGQFPWLAYDWIEGGIANDSVISTVDACVDGFINAEQALDRLVNEKLRHQVCISRQSIVDCFLTFDSSEKIRI